MNNVFKNFEIGLRFDLKGSTQGRRTLNAGEPIINAYKNIKSPLKDQDFIENVQQITLN